MAAHTLRDPDGYSWALGLTTGLQAIAAVVLATAPKHPNRA